MSFWFDFFSFLKAERTASLRADNAKARPTIEFYFVISNHLAGNAIILFCEFTFVRLFLNFKYAFFVVFCSFFSFDGVFYACSRWL